MKEKQTCSNKQEQAVERKIKLLNSNETYDLVLYIKLRVNKKYQSW